MRPTGTSPVPDPPSYTMPQQRTMFVGKQRKQIANINWLYQKLISCLYSFKYNWHLEAICKPQLNVIENIIRQRRSVLIRPNVWQVQ